MKKHLLSIILGVFIGIIPQLSYAQYVIKGIVKSTTGEVLVGTNVILKPIKNNDVPMGTSTALDGTFSLSTDTGTYQMEISYIGYTTYITQVEVKGNVNLPPITLSEDTQLMNEVVVTARTITYNTDGYIAKVSKNPLYKDMDMTSVLKMSPGTHATYNSVELFGQSVSKIYLNGRELKLHGEELIRYLETIDAKNVKQMEVITASGVEEDAVNKGKSIIKITTANPETGGMANVGASSMNGEDKNIHTAYTSINWRINPQWGMYFNANGAFGNSIYGNRTETHFYDTDTWRTNESTTRNKLNGNLRTILGVSYDLDANNLFSLEGTFQLNKRTSPSGSSVRNLSEGIYTDIADGSVDAMRKYENYNLSFIYTHKFNQDAQLEFKADRLETNTDDNSRQRYEYTGSDHTAYNHENGEKDVIYTTRLDFTQKFKALNGKFSAGMKGTWFSSDNCTDYANYLNGEQDNITSYTDLYKYKEDVYALYAKYAFTYKNLSMDFGIRMEHTQVSPESSSNPERSYKNDYTDFFPEMGLSYTINREKGHNINLSYDRGIIRPSMENLNPLVRRTSEYSYSMGNPLLDANYYHSLTMTGTFFNKYILNLSYRISDDGTMLITENKDGILYNSYLKGQKSRYLYAHLGVPVKIGKRLDVRFNFNYRHLKESDSDNESSHHTWAAGYTVNLTLPNHFRIEHHLFYSPVYKTLYGKSSEHPSCNVTITKTFPKRGLNIGLTMADIFNQGGSKRNDTFRNDFYQISKGTNNNFGISLRVGYSLRWGKKFMVRRTMSGNMEESGRVASE